MKQFQQIEVPHIVPAPKSGGKVLSLSGDWMVTYEGSDTAYTVPVPTDMGIYRASHPDFSRKYTYTKKVTFPKNTSYPRTLIRFEAVNGYAELYIDGEFVAHHWNGFTTWNQEITTFVKDKESFTITLTVDETADNISTYNHGGLLKPVELYLLPESYVASVYLDTTFDEDFQDAVLELEYNIQHESTDLRYQIECLAPDGTVVEKAKQQRLPSQESTFSIPFEKPVQWDAEHPELYTIRFTIFKENELLEQVEKRFGFREITREGNQLFVNGKEVKLRGACRHDISPLNGRSLTRELTEEDVGLFKEANCNYIRTSHYPPTEYFLDLCDEKGIYVENELPLAFIARTLDYTQRDPAHTQRYLSYFADLYARDQAHPSVLIWSICNESFGGHNFDLLNQYIKYLDPTRPTKFSYPMTMRQEHEPIDIWSIHYANLDSDLAKKADNVSVGYAPGYDKPVIHDEYVHVPCYNRPERRRDPLVESFWGESITKFWDKIWNTKGALGGAIWAGIDETSLYVGGNTCLDWGIIDIWRRKKPEFYQTRKAYSPLTIRQTELTPQNDGNVTAEVENRFCHTNLSELTVVASNEDKKEELTLPATAPREMAQLVLPRELFSLEGSLRLDFYDAYDNHVDEYLLTLPTYQQHCKKEQSSDLVGTLTATETEQDITVHSSTMTLIFSKKTGLLTKGMVNGKEVLVGGPYLNVPHLYLGQWNKKALRCKKQGDAYQVTIQGSYQDTLEITFTLLISSTGEIKTSYRIDTLYVSMPRKLKLRVGVDGGGLDELGVYYLTSPTMDSLSWQRKGEWSIYPSDHIARTKGTAKRKTKETPFGEKPEISWAEDMTTITLNGIYDVSYKGSNDFRSTKANIYHASLQSDATLAGVQAVTEGDLHVRLQVEDPENLILSDRDKRIAYSGAWYPREDKESHNGTEMWSKEAGATAECSFTGTGIVWYAPVDMVYGLAKVYIDGELVDDSVNLKVNGAEFSGSALAHDKKHRFPVFSMDGLPYGNHTLHIEVTGEHTPDSSDSYIVIDYFRILTGRQKEPVRFIMNHEFNFPQIAWGNYSKPPILIAEGYENQVTMRLYDKS